jgi:3-deoxy-D-arabino-heptulosonate 7-phosphate (DAHP) synthase class II
MIKLIMVNLKESQLSALPCCWMLFILVMAGCGDPFDRQVGLSDLEDPSPTVRIMAIKWAGENKVKEALPQLVDSLEDEDPSVRFYAIEGLRRITGTDNDYDYKAPAYERAASIERWQEFLNAKE